jgi:threonylcarbamoyladenosine tRNA methylthiotransferase MtaB
MKTFYIKTLGCKVNSYESEFIRTLFLKNGYVEKEHLADIYIINTCIVTNNSGLKSKKIINSIRKNNPDSIIIAMGCFTQYAGESVNNLIDADIIIGNTEKSKVIEHLNKYMENNNKLYLVGSMENVDFEDMEINYPECHHRAFVKIEDGCNNFCSYCIIPYVRGRVRSKEKQKVISEITSLINVGHKEIVLTGIHTGQYSDKDYKLNHLINDLCNIKGLKRLRLSSIEVVEINEDILNNLRIHNNFVSHLHIPLQSGCDKILKSMNRRYDTAYFTNKINEIRTIRPEISITTDVIVGFPGETEEEYINTYNYCNDIKFSKIHVFPYSDRNGTVASKMENKVSSVTKKNRVKRLLELSEELEKEYFNKFIGKSLEVLIEEEKDDYFYGYTSNYLYLKIKGDYKLNEIYKVIITEDMNVHNK